MGAKIMLIEDDVDTRQGLLLRLRANGYETAWAQDAISAVAAAVREKPDLILLDLGLPGGDGFVVMERLQSLALSAPIIVLSGRDPAFHRDRALRAGAAAFLQKPADNEEILAAIKEHLPGGLAPREPQQGKRNKIMLIEDDVDTRQGLLLRLRANGYETAWAQDAISAVATAVREKPDLILLDLGLPGGDGFVVMERLQSLALSAPIIVLSGRDPAFHRDRALRAGAAAFLQKPADNEEILAAIKEHLPNNDNLQGGINGQGYKTIRFEGKPDAGPLTWSSGTLAR